MIATHGRDVVSPWLSMRPLLGLALVYFFLLRALCPFVFASSERQPVQPVSEPLEPPSEACVRALTETVVFPIQKVYPHVKIPRDHQGVPVVPYGSKAFALWRSRTSGWIPDTAFLVHYLTENEIAMMAIVEGRRLIGEAYRNFGSLLDESTKVVSQGAPASSFVMPQRKGLLDLRVGLLRSYLTRDFLDDLGHGGRGEFKYIIFVKDLSFEVVLFPNFSIDHKLVASQILAVNPEWRVLAGDTLSFSFIENEFEASFRFHKAWFPEAQKDQSSFEQFARLDRDLEYEILYDQLHPWLDVLMSHFGIDQIRFYLHRSGYKDIDDDEM